jgi:hypothetical protein
VFLQKTQERSFFSIIYDDLRMIVDLLANNYEKIGKLPKDVIEQVFLGANINDTNIDRVKCAKIKHNLKADFFSMSLSKKEYRLIPTPYK